MKKEDYDRACVHESGHALMALLQGLECYGIYFAKTDEKFCTVTDIPEPSQCCKKHYLFLAASSAAELIIYGDYNEEGAKSDMDNFGVIGAPPLQETINEAQIILMTKTPQLNRLISMLKAKCEEVNYEFERLNEVGMNGSAQKFAVLMSQEDVRVTVQWQ